ncbi:Aldehyde/histidinol dehydrogenase [Fusarium oxysporum Fo47]|uniref:Aldehyde/histidinol dehydrogenase n=1 Tax=Fusarium oxysporum Fo47 TaxID=660027 RepID=UPI002869D435|nr:Aldehyde/histidinol dehydrogenase [Fusarium oxysporum Fo47]QKD48607.2 Aldehyde/histidinol dehydrogenase [Fusarium oxysporum Fo47]
MSTFPYPEPANAGDLSYAPASEERRLLKEALAEAEKSVFKIPTIVNGERIYSGRKSYQVNPWNRRAPLSEYHEADQETRAAVYKRAAQLVEGKYRWKIMAATMIGQGKTCGQAEGDCIAEVIDTLNFHVYFCHQLYQQQPPKQTDSAYSSLDYRPLEGFILAISPFNFTALGAHIAFTPAILDNVILWKPSPMAVLSNYLLYQIFEEAGLPSGVVQFLPVADPKIVVEPALASRDFSGLHYTGSSAVLRSLTSQIGTNTATYKTFPRIVGESGGKNFHLVHNSFDDVDWLASAAVRSAYEFQGQKCSALSRLFVPESLWEKGDLKKSLLREAAKFTHGDDIKQIHHPLGPIVSEAAFNRFGEFIQQAKKEGHELIYGGRQDGSKGFFLQPAIFEVNPSDQSGESDLMTKEIFGPLFAVQTYDDASPTGFEDVCDLIDRTTEYGLAGAVFSRDRYAVQIASDRLRDSVGMLVINDKCTGAVIGANPFGGARSSGTNDTFTISITSNSALPSCLLLRTWFSILKSVFLDKMEKRLITTVGTKVSKQRVEKELSEHSSKLEVLLAKDNVRAVEQADVVILAFKPVKREEVFAAPGIKEALRGKLVISIMAGVSIKELNRLALEQGDPIPVQAVRAMPNMAAKIRQAVTLYTVSEASFSDKNKDLTAWVFSQVGEAQQIPETNFDISAVLVGCAGSLLLLAVDGLLDAAVAEGVKRPEATKMVVSSAIGMLGLVPAGNHPSVLRENIASPGGCSIRALLELEKLGVRSAYTTAILTAAEKSKGLSK